MTALTNEQANLLDNLAAQSKADMWFSISDDLTTIIDLDENKTMSLQEGIAMLDDCLTDFADYQITAEEIHLYKNILTELHIPSYR